MFVAGTLLPNRSTHVRVVNASEKPVVVHQATNVIDVSTASTVPVATGSTAAEQPTPDAVIDEMVSKVESSITEEIKERLRELLRK